MSYYKILQFVNYSCIVDTDKQGLCDMDENKLTFEEAFRQLSELVKKMEAGDMPLAASVAAYEQGVKLKAYCEQLLREAELKIETLKVTPPQA